MDQRRNDQHKLPPLEMPPHNRHHHPPPPPHKCPRCDSSNTKFCYYNNYSLSQPRYFCKACRRYWTQGGTLRNVPVGGGCRKSKRPRPSVPAPSAAEIRQPALPPQTLTAALRPLPSMMASSSVGNTFYSGGSFLSSLAAMQPLPNHGSVNLGGQYEANIAVLQSMKPPPPPPQQFQLHNDQYFSSQQNLRPSWTEGFMNKGPATAASSSFWSGAAAAGNNQAGSSFSRNHWQDSDPSSH